MRMLLVSGLIWHTSFGLIVWTLWQVGCQRLSMKHALHSQVHRSSGRSINNHSLTQTVCKYCCLISEHRLPKHCNQNKSANLSFCKRDSSQLVAHYTVFRLFSFIRGRLTSNCHFCSLIAILQQLCHFCGDTYEFLFQFESPVGLWLYIVNFDTYRFLIIIYIYNRLFVIGMLIDPIQLLLASDWQQTDSVLLLL